MTFHAHNANCFFNNSCEKYVMCTGLMFILTSQTRVNCRNFGKEATWTTGQEILSGKVLKYTMNAIRTWNLRQRCPLLAFRDDGTRKIPTVEKVRHIKGQELNTATTLASRPHNGHRLSFIITIVIMTLGWGLFVELAVVSCGRVCFPCLKIMSVVCTDNDKIAPNIISELYTSMCLPLPILIVHLDDYR